MTFQAMIIAANEIGNYIQNMSGQIKNNDEH